MAGARPLGNIAVTGASGFIGRRLVRHLQDRGETIRQWSRPEVDLFVPASIAAAASRDQPDTIFHLAAAGVSAARAHDADVIVQDLRMTENLMASAPEGARILFAGSMSEYGRAGRLAEIDRCTPRTAYGIAKLASGQFAAAYAPRRSQQVAILRLFGVYGPGEAPQRLFHALVRALGAGEAVELSDGTQRRDFIHVDDACAAMADIAAALIGDNPIINIGTGKAVCVRDVAEWIADSMGASHDLLRFGTRPRSPGDEDLLEADTARLAAIIGHTPPQRLLPGLSAALFTS